MKKYFTLGLSILLPFVITIIILKLTLDTLSAPFYDIVSNFLTQSHAFENYYFIVDPAFLIDVSSRLISLAILITLAFILGYLARIIVVKRIFKRINDLIMQIPGISGIYKILQEAAHKFLKKNHRTYMQVVLVPYPNSICLSVGLLSHSTDQHPLLPNDLISVFIPTMPNPTVGFVLQFKQSDLIYIDMPIPDALKCIISSGAMIPPFAIEKNPKIYQQHANNK